MEAAVARSMEAAFEETFENGVAGKAGELESRPTLEANVAAKE